MSGRALAFVPGYGVAWFATYTVVLNWADQHLEADTAALLVNVAPILVAVVAVVAFYDGFPRPVKSPTPSAVPSPGWCFSASGPP